MSITELVSTIHLKDTLTFTLHSQFLNHNFEVVRECLLKIKDVENTLGKSKDNTNLLQERIKILEEKLSKNIDNTYQNDTKIKELSNNIGDDFMKKMYAIEQKTKNMYDFEETVHRLEKLNKFVLKGQYDGNNLEIKAQCDKLWKMQEQLQRYLKNIDFNEYKQDQIAIIQEKQRNIDQLKDQINKFESQIQGLRVNMKDLTDQIKQNNKMMKEISFSEMVQKLRKFQEDTSIKVGQMAVKMKKKVNQSQLLAMEKIMIDKLDRFLNQTEQNMPQKAQTKQAFMFLEKKIVQLEQIVQKKLLEQDNGLFTTKKVQCASCTKDLGKYEGKLGQYHPWSSFPCKQLDPEKSGGFGYLNYVDKTAFKRGFDTQDQNLQRLSKTIYDPKETTPKKVTTHRGSHIIQNFGSEEREHSLKQSYFKDSTRVGSTNNKTFRVSKKQTAKATDQIVDKLKET